MNKLKAWHCIVIATIATSVVSCRGDLVYSEAQSVEKEGWFFKDTLVFSPVIEDPNSTYDLSIWVRHTKAYAYSNIWFRVISDPIFTTDSTGLVEITLADKTGQWLGSCSQSFCTASLPVATDFDFGEVSAFKVEVVQYMREETLEGVREIGIDLSPHVITD